MVAHEVMLSDFFIDRTEVTNRDYRRCIAVGVCDAPRDRGALRWTQRDDHPVTLVTWSDADRYCRWRGARLPSEAEWERAARGLNGRVFPWGNVFNPYLVNHGRPGRIDRLDDRDGYAELAPVASFVAGATTEGIYDLAGNVEEWVADWYAEGYVEPQKRDPRGPALGNFRVVRGGSYRDGRAWLRGAARNRALPSVALPWVGFRCASDARSKGSP
jgi:formylglycine-generating enzyme required for sulfatase activity